MNYVRLALSVFDTKKFSNKKISTMDINFICEMLSDQTAEIYLNDQETTSQIDIKESQSGKSTFKAEINWI